MSLKAHGNSITFPASYSDFSSLKTYSF